MKIYYPSILIGLITTLLIGCNIENTEVKDQTYQSDNASFNYAGRIHATDSGQHLISAGSYIEASIAGDSCVIDISNLYPEVNQYIAISVDSVYLGRFLVNNQPIKIPLLPNTLNNKLKIYKATEAVNGPLLFRGITTGKLFKISENKQVYIEFIGNSITCGMGAELEEVPCETGQWTDQHNAYFSYASLIARSLNADFTLSCVSGIGIYRNWNDEDQPIMPDVYNHLNLTADSTLKYEHNKGPRIISIALGTNDFSDGDGEKDRTEFSEEAFVSSYTEFLNSLIQKHPDAKIVLLNSPMLDQAKKQILTSCLNKVKNNLPEQLITIFEFQPMTPGGCGSHPDIEDHQVMADQLLPVFTKLLNS